MNSLNQLSHPRRHCNVAVNNKQINILYDSFNVNTTSGDTRALCKLASVKTRQIHHTNRFHKLTFRNVNDPDLLSTIKAEMCFRTFLSYKQNPYKSDHFENGILRNARKGELKKKSPSLRKQTRAWISL